MSLAGGFAEDPVLIPDVATPIRAWRCWSLSTFRGRWALCSARIALTDYTRGGVTCTYDGSVYWTVGGIEARCLCPRFHSVDEHEQVPGAPLNRTRAGDWVSNYACGIYAMKDRDRLLSGEWSLPPSCVVGRVQLGGRIWEHSAGYRAQFAKIEALESALPFMKVIAGDDVNAVMRELARRYRVPYEGDTDG